MEKFDFWRDQFNIPDMPAERYKKLSYSEKYNTLHKALEGASEEQKLRINKQMELIRPRATKERGGKVSLTELYPALGEFIDWVTDLLGLFLVATAIVVLSKWATNNYKNPSWIVFGIGWFSLLFGVELIFRSKITKLKKEVLRLFKTGKYD